MRRRGWRSGIRLGRLHGLMAAGLVDSFGLAFGWTVFNLHAVTKQGLASVGVYNAAMLVGVALSAPAVAVLSTRLDGRRLLQATAVAEAACRVGSFVLLLGGAPVPIVAASVVLMNVLAWTGYAGMRAEVAAVSNRSAAMTGYMVCIASIEAVGVAVAAVLPVGSDNTVTGPLLVAVIAWYGLCLVPQLLAGVGARVRKAGRRTSRTRMSRSALPLGGGFVVMLLASGPTLLSVGLAAEFHGRMWVAASAIAFTAGSLAAPLLAAAEERTRLAPVISWPWLGAGMIAGWVAAPFHPAGLLVAQVLAGLCMTAFEGTMDARAAAQAPDGRVTASLAWTASARAFGSALAVAAIPVALAVSTVQFVSAVSASLLVLLGLGALAVSLGAARLRRSGPDVEPVPVDVVQAVPTLPAAEVAPAATKVHAADTPDRAPSGPLAPVVRLRVATVPSEPISPELVLVDPDLARRLRENVAEVVPLVWPTTGHQRGSAAKRESVPGRRDTASGSS